MVFQLLHQRNVMCEGFKVIAVIEETSKLLGSESRSLLITSLQYPLHCGPVFTAECTPQHAKVREVVHWGSMVADEVGDQGTVAHAASQAQGKVVPPSHLSTCSSITLASTMYQHASIHWLKYSFEVLTCTSIYRSKVLACNSCISIWIKYRSKRCCSSAHLSTGSRRQCSILTCIDEEVNDGQLAMIACEGKGEGEARCAGSG
jgi:hypothetical protein